MRGDIVILNHTPGMTQLAIRPAVERSTLSERLVDFLDQQESLCDQLETIADNLPNGVCWLQCTNVADRLGVLVRKAHRFEEESIFPCLARTATTDNAIVQSIVRLEWEHIEDEGFADEIADAFMSHLDKSHGNGSQENGPQETGIDKLGYMLRGFFESMRRHIAFEREHVLPLVTATERGAVHV